MARAKIQSGSSAQRPAAIISPVVDFLCCGGISIIAVVCLFAYSWIDPYHPLFTKGVELTDIIVLSFLINFPHFMASYRLLYRTREQVVEHSWAAIFVPVLLLVAIGYALLTPSQAPDNPEFANGAVVELLTLLAAMLLAWHYTGQAWGMTASFAFISGIRMEPLERRFIRCGYLALMVFHLLWATLVALSDPQFVFFSSLLGGYTGELVVAYNLWTVVVLLSFPVGVVGFVHIYRRTGIVPSLRSYGPWIAIYLWYALIWAYPGLFLCLQLFHALQYIIFPLRVEMNQYSAYQSNRRRVVIHTAVFYIVLVIAGLAVFAPPYSLAAYLDDREFALGALVVAFVNIHHYVIDGAIWKIRNPKVRRLLFAHLQT